MITPICYPAMQLSSAWTEEPDSASGGKCIITPGTPTKPLEVLFAPEASKPGQPWANAYILQRHPFAPITRFEYAISVMFPSQADINATEAFEKDRQDNDGHTIFNWGWQLRNSDGGIHLWNRSVHGGGSDPWGKPVMPFSPFRPGEWKTVTVLGSRDDAHITYLGIGIDAKWTPLDVTYDAVAHAQTPYLNNAFQLDSRGKGAPINVAVTACTLSGF